MSGSFKLEQFFEVVNTDNNMFHFKPKGFFSNEAALVLQDEFLAINKSIIDSYGGRPFVIIADMSEAAVPSDKAKLIIQQNMRYAHENGLAGSIEIYTSALTRMTVTRMLKDSGANMNSNERIIVGSLNEALAKADEILCEPA